MTLKSFQTQFLMKIYAKIKNDNLLTSKWPKSNIFSKKLHKFLGLKKVLNKYDIHVYNV